MLIFLTKYGNKFNIVGSQPLFFSLMQMIVTTVMRTATRITTTITGITITIVAAPVYIKTDCGMSSVQPE